MINILFRGRIKGKKQWVFGSLISPDCTKDGEAYIKNLKGTYKVDASTICQYTTLCDMHKKMIFDGDILRIISCNPQQTSVISLVSFSQGAYHTNGKLLDWVLLSNRVEIIGNIIDNPELCKVPRWKQI